ncbi:MAG: DUF4348 domain-containing protein [Caldithrix sp.]|nr:DUF4348 domain-containing protein [Caldithrix sp.]
METKRKLFFIFLIMLSTNLLGNNTNEDFISFLVKFSFDKDLQIARINFPLNKLSYSDNLEKTIPEKIERKYWTHIQLIDAKQNYITDIKNDFNKEEKDTDERIFSFIGVETGISLKYFFKRDKGLWYLVKVEDFST